MGTDDLDLLLDRVPCPMVRLHLVGGMIFDIRDPDAVVVGHTTVEFLLPPDGSNLREAVVSLSQILWAEVIEPAE